MQNEKPNDNPPFKVPQLLCKGCQGREQIIRSLSAEIDRQSAEISELKQLEDVQAIDETGRLAA